MTTPEIARLNPFDGLFLRAVHLEQIQRYTQALTRALGMAGGPGVVHGFGPALAADAGKPPSRLTVQPGLAVAADGRILLSSATLAVPLPAAGDTVAWRIELVATEEPFGPENTYGDVCLDPCSSPSSSTAFVGETVDVRLAPLSVPSTVDAGATSFRNRVASWYFERERRDGHPYLAASDRDTDQERGRSILDAAWAQPTGPAPGPVAVGLLLRSADGFLVDVWAARRDRVQTAPETGWTQRLAMRPWAAFVAQVLQFQDQVAASWPGVRGPSTPGAPLPTSVRADVSAKLSEALQQLHVRKLREPTELVQGALTALRSERTAAATVISLVDLGFDDLPPAGYLPLSTTDILGDGLGLLFPASMSVTVNAYRADEIVEMVARTQHLDRIPLTEPDGLVEPETRIEIMVPVPDPFTDAHDLQSVRSWVAFRRLVHLPDVAREDSDPTGGTDDPDGGDAPTPARDAVPVVAPPPAGDG